MFNGLRVCIKRVRSAKGLRVCTKIRSIVGSWY